jgi:toxin HigB-1
MIFLDPMIHNFIENKVRAVVFECHFANRYRMIHTRLHRLAAATTLADLEAIPGNRLEVLKGERQGHYRIRVNSQWWICFRWLEREGAHDVEIRDHY